MPKSPAVRIRFSDGTTMELPENDSVHIVSAGPSDKPQDGWQRINGEATPPLYGKLAKTRAAALNRGQHLVTFRGVLLIEGAQRI